MRSNLLLETLDPEKIDQENLIELIGQTEESIIIDPDELIFPDLNYSTPSITKRPTWRF